MDQCAFAGQLDVARALAQMAASIRSVAAAVESSRNEGVSIGMAGLNILKAASMNATMPRDQHQLINGRTIHSLEDKSHQ